MEAVGCRIAGGQEAKTEILVKSRIRILIKAGVTQLLLDCYCYHPLHRKERHRTLAPNTSSQIFVSLPGQFRQWYEGASSTPEQCSVEQLPFHNEGGKSKK